jgi:type III secretion protein J
VILRVASRGRRPLAALFLALALAGCQVELFTGLSEREANEMLAILLRAGIDADKITAAEGLMTLNVDEKRFAEAVDLLKRQGYPRETFASIGEVFKKEGLISSPLEERVRFVYALSQELSQTISEIDGVLSARVHVVLPNNELAMENIVPSSAAVFIRHQADVPLDRLIPQIKMLVTNSIQGLAYDKVSVILFPVETDFRIADEVRLREIGGIRLHPTSVNEFWMITGGLAGLAILGLLGCGVLFWLWRRAATAVPPGSVTADAG